ncbi:MAG TPA: trypsin-like peptidase domain-containing protein [Dehalococcoidia bacterium]|nr:trypsin-like peptidase domain-containing protein [Dehalococcoidia bacterium]
MRRFTSILALVVISVLVGAAAVVGINSVRGDNDSDAPAAVAQTTDTGGAKQVSTNSNAPSLVAAGNTDFSALYDSVHQSIVEITIGTQGSTPFDQQAQGLGSGIVLDTQGHILTNNHVVEGSNTVQVTFVDGTTAQADVVGTDPGDDLAMVKVNADQKELHPAKLGNSDSVKVGNVVAAIGNPFGLEDSFTTGVISGLNRTLSSGSDGRPLRNLLQTDAAVNPGNSGGALINTSGEIIGINTAIENPGGNSFAGVAYAVPINTAKTYMDQLQQGSAISHPRLGIAGSTLSPSDAKKLGVKGGVAVVSVDSGSAADQAGIKSSSNNTGDVITAIDGQPVTTFEQLANYIDTKHVGDKVTITVHRDGKDMQVTATLQAWNSAA